MPEAGAETEVNLCNTCQKLWQDCGMFPVRTTVYVGRRYSSYGRVIAGGLLYTIRCPGYVFWPGRFLALAAQAA